MPRQSRIDIPGLLQHVIVRGIERRNIFRTNNDRQDFIDRFSSLLIETETECYAWALIPNHFHLLLKPKGCDLKHFMRRLLTGYAVNFNKRHRRSGHLFQNRYKSIVCEEDTYLLELIRYIHLNPLRAGLVKNLDTLNRYPWCGHSVLLGKAAVEGQCTGEVLAFFSHHLNEAQENYQNFIADGIEQGHRPELVGGGLKRSLTNQLADEPQAYDERILGSGDFVEKLNEERSLQEKIVTRINLDELVNRVADHCGIPANDLVLRSRNQQRIDARDLLCYVAVRILRYSGTETGKLLGLQRAAVSHAVKRGSLLVSKEGWIIEKILSR